MNEKIKEILSKSYTTRKETYDGEIYYEYEELDPEKFAELIVRECIDIMQNCDGDIDFAIWKTKKDFGVEP